MSTGLAGTIQLNVSWVGATRRVAHVVGRLRTSRRLVPTSNQPVRQCITCNILLVINIQTNAFALLNPSGSAARNDVSESKPIPLNNFADCDRDGF